MQIFQYVKGTKESPNAFGYKLWRGSVTTGDDGYKFTPIGNAPIATRDKITALDIKGAVGRDAKVTGNQLERQSTCAENGKINKFYPLTKSTDRGREYYIKITGRMLIWSSRPDDQLHPFDPPTLVKSFEGVLNLNSDTRYTFQYEKKMEVTESGIYLKVTIGKNDGSSDAQNGVTETKLVKLSSVGAGSVDSAFVEDGRVVVWHALAGYERTGFIPIDVLTNDADGACFGVVERNAVDDEGTSAYDIAFYSNRSFSSFLGGATYNDIASYLDNGYLTVEDINAWLSNQSYKNNVRYVIFSSHVGDVYDDNETYRKDYVSTGKLYFDLSPLYDVLQDGDCLAVTAKGDGKFYIDSDYGFLDANGNPVIYQKATS